MLSVHIVFYLTLRSRDMLIKVKKTQTSHNSLLIPTCIDILSLLLSSTTSLSGDDLFSAPKLSQSFSNSNLRHLWHSSDSDHLPVPELWSFSYSKPLPAIPNTTMCSFHPSTSPDTSSRGCSETSTSYKGNSETSSNSAPSDPNAALTFSGYSQGCSGDGVAPMVSDIKGRVIVICNIKGWGWSGSMGNARQRPWSQTSIV